jgi:tetratricopeptide (TPR) repeat protein
LDNKIDKEVKMCKKPCIYPSGLVLIVMACLCLVLTGCSSTKLTYKASGTAAQAEVEYRDEKGQLTKQTVSLPWDKTISIGAKFSFRVNVTNTTDSGTVICAVLMNGKEMGPTTGVRYARCNGDISKQGSSTSWDFHGEYDKPQVAQAPTATRTAASTRAATATRAPVASPTSGATAQYLYERGVNEYNKGNYDQATTNFTQAIGLDPKHAKAYYMRGLAYYRQSIPAQAIMDFTRAIELDPKYVEAYNDRGSTYNGQGKYDEALRDLNQAIQLDPKYAAAYVNRCATYRNKNLYDQALADCSQAIELNPKLAIAYNNRANAYAGKGNLDLALADYTQCVGIDPKYAPAYKNRGTIYARQGVKAQAIADYELYLSLAPNAADRPQIEQEIRKLKGQ